MRLRPHVDMKHRISNMKSGCITTNGKTVQLLFFFVYIAFSLCVLFSFYNSSHNKWYELLYDARCTSIINNLFSVKVHIEAAACWLDSFGKMALIFHVERERMHFKDIMK